MLIAYALLGIVLATAMLYAAGWPGHNNWIQAILVCVLFVIFFVVIAALWPICLGLLIGKYIYG